MKIHENPPFIAGFFHGNGLLPIGPCGHCRVHHQGRETTVGLDLNGLVSDVSASVPKKIWHWHC